MTMGTLITGEQLMRLPRHDKRYELVKGELIEMSPPGGEHGECAGRIHHFLSEFVDKHDLGRTGVESGFYLARNPDTVRGPDVLFISKERLDPGIEVEGYYEVIPDLVVEVISPNDTFHEISEKIAEYLAAGVRLVWVLNPKRRSVIVYPGGHTLTEEDILTGGDVLPGFSVSISRLFSHRRS